MNKENMVTIHTPHGEFWVRKCVLLEAVKTVTTMLTRWDEFSTTIEVGGAWGRVPYNATSYYSYSVEVGVYADTGNVYMKVKAVKNQRHINRITKAVSWSNKVVYTDMRSTHTLGREVI